MVNVYLLMGLIQCLVGILLQHTTAKEVEFLNTTDIITEHGYPAESHVVTTADGYLLTVHRIPFSPKLPASSLKRLPVLLHHGISVSSDVWVLTGPDKGLAFLLADEGYDVWMANARGNLYSRNHLTLSPEDKTFWNFTLQEIGVYDLPAVMDHIISVTSHPEVMYVGHSMGSAVFFILTTQKPEYNEKVRLMVGMAPAVFNGQRGSFSDAYARFTLWWNGKEELDRRTPSTDHFWNQLCRDEAWTQFLCTALYFKVYGYNMKELNSTLLPVYITRLQSGTSARTMEQFVQMFETGRFQQYDPGARGRGRAALTPQYDLALTSAPVAIYYGQNDAVIRPKGIFRLRDSLPNVVKTVRVPDKDFSHADFMFSNHVKTLLYDDVIALLNVYRY